MFFSVILSCIFNYCIYNNVVKLALLKLYCITMQPYNTKIHNNESMTLLVAPEPRRQGSLGE